MKAERRCRRLHYYRYVLGVVALSVGEALRLGTLVHLGLEAWWRWFMVRGDGADMTVSSPLENALLVMRETREQDLFLLAKAEVMLEGYDLRWAADARNFEVIGVELQFAAPLVNPDSGKLSRTFTTAGKLDVLVRDLAGDYVPVNDLAFIEHKSSSEDIGAGATYWRRLRIDSQVATYFAGADALVQQLGLQGEVGGCVYDVLKKTSLRPSKATPFELRKYTKEKTAKCTSCKGHGCQDCSGTGKVVTEPSRLHANQREADETVEEYQQRVRLDLVGDVNAADGFDESQVLANFVRDTVVRTTGELEEARRDVWQQAEVMRDNDRLKRYPRNPDACFLYGRNCDYVEVCGGVADIDDPTKFRRVADPHVELSPAVGE